MVCCLWVLMTQETHGQIDIAQISPVSSFQCWNTLSLDSSPRWASLSQVPSVTPPDSVYYTAYTSLKPTTVNLPGKKENICSTKHNLSTACLGLPDQLCQSQELWQPHFSAPPDPIFHPACPHGWNTSTSSFQVCFYDEKCTEGVLIKTSCHALYYLVWWSLYC